VLDEADEMLDLGFLEDVETILSRCPSGRQTALFSATIPAEVKRLAETRMFDPVAIKVRAATLTIDTVDQFYVEVGDREKAEALARVLKSERPDQAIIFVRTKIGADRLARGLGDRGGRSPWSPRSSGATSPRSSAPPTPRSWPGRRTAGRPRASAASPGGRGTRSPPWSTGTAAGPS